MKMTILIHKCSLKNIHIEAKIVKISLAYFIESFTRETSSVKRSKIILI